jgi:hypothetical protein
VGWYVRHGDVNELRGVRSVRRIKVVVPPRVGDKEAAHCNELGDGLGGAQVHDRVTSYAPKEWGSRVRVRGKIKDDLFSDQEFSSGAVLYVCKFARGVSTPRVRVDRTVRRREFPRSLEVFDGKRRVNCCDVHIGTKGVEILVVDQVGTGEGVNADENTWITTHGSVRSGRILANITKGSATPRMQLKRGALPRGRGPKREGRRTRRSRCTVVLLSSALMCVRLEACRRGTSLCVVGARQGLDGFDAKFSKRVLSMGMFQTRFQFDVVAIAP